MDSLLDWLVVILPLLLTTWPLLVSVEAVLKKHPWKWRVTLVVLGLVLAVLTRLQQTKTDAEHRIEIGSVQTKLDNATGQLTLVANTLDEYRNRKCEGFPEMSAAIKKFLATVPARPTAPPNKQQPAVSVAPPLPPEAQLSTDELRARVSDVSQKLRWSWVERRAAEQELNNWKQQKHDKRYDDKSITLEDLNKNDDYWDQKISASNTKFENDLNATFAEADKLRKEMLRRLPPSKWTNDDRDKDKDALFQGISPTDAADYIEKLAKRV